MTRIIRDGEGLTLGSPDVRRNRFLLDADDTQRRLSVVEHSIGPRVLAAPVHIHTNEDEYSLVLEGRLGALLGDEEVYAEVGDFVAKPRGQWHTFWNAGDTPLRLLEIITPGGLEDLFKTFGHAEEYDVAALPNMAAEYGCRLDLDRTGAVAARFGLTF